MIAPFGSISLRFSGSSCHPSNSYAASASGTALVGGDDKAGVAIAMTAARVVIEDGMINDVALAVGSCSPVAKRLPEFEQFLQGRKVSEIEALSIEGDELLTPLSPISDVRGSGEYRLDVVAELCRRAVLKAAGGA